MFHHAQKMASRALVMKIKFSILVLVDSLIQSRQNCTMEIFKENFYADHVTSMSDVALTCLRRAWRC